ncbi:MAG TPA: cyclic nucleotide-binding domain-containing protein, partial [Candidatus Limnocylindrales bacterium]|nr:cyclic nucleotide-binding domain-containing protein [Candidatus Limnocylindrales bacterium]
RQGEIGTGFFVVIDGRVRVVRDGSLIATLGPGEFFGELSVLDRQPRNAMVAAEVATTCLALASWDFEAVLLEQPRLTLAILRGVAVRLRTATDSARH